MRQVGVAVFGTGFIGARAHIPSLKRIDGVKLAGIATSKKQLPERLKQPGTKIVKSYRELLDDPEVEAVWICTPNQMHEAVTIEAIEAGKHVFCEMPLASTVEGCRRIVDATKRNGVMVVPGANFRWTPNYVKVKELMETLGSPSMFYHREYLAPSIIGEQWPAGSWAWDKEQSGGTSFTLAGWAIDLMRWLVEDDITSVYARISELPQPAYGGITPENCQFHATFAGGAFGVFERSENSPYLMQKAELRILFDGNKAVWAADNNRLELHHEMSRVDAWEWHEPGPRVWGHEQIDRHFIDCIRNDTEPLVTPTDGLKAVEIAQAMLNSAKTGDVIRLGEEIQRPREAPRGAEAAEVQPR